MGTQPIVESLLRQLKSVSKQKQELIDMLILKLELAYNSIDCLSSQNESLTQTISNMENKKKKGKAE